MTESVQGSNNTRVEYQLPIVITAVLLNHELIKNLLLHRAALLQSF